VGKQYVTIVDAEGKTTIIPRDFAKIETDGYPQDKERLRHER
jgi:hypothetical protein